MEITLINEKDQSYASNKLGKYYENGLIPAEKKAYLTELTNNNGPFMGIETEGNKTHYLMDAASQIATLGLGFSPSVFMGTGHHLSAWTNNVNDPDFLKIKDAFHSFLMRKTGWKHLDMTICNSGAESNEIALGYAFERRKNKKAHKVLAFEGSFHGRMLISLFSTWNKTKREPFQWPGFETTFTAYPELPGAEINQKYPDGWRNFWDESPSKEFNVPKEWMQDSILKEEVECLVGVRDQLLKGEVFSIITETMQCEGGDRYASDRFHTALLLMAKSFEVAVIHDEVQTGFHLGREFFWHRQFCLTDTSGNQLNPDYLVCAKKAQVGLVLSPHDLKRNRLEQMEQYQAASVIRGYYHGLALDQSRLKIIELEKYTKEKLKNLANKYPEQISRTRALGMSFAFDLKDAETTTEFISKRFEHGLLYYPAGAKTLRFRLNTSFSEKDIDFLFERLDEIANEVFNGTKSDFSGKTLTAKRPLTKTRAWQNLLLEARLQRTQGKLPSYQEALKNLQEHFQKYYLDEGASKELEFVVINKDNFSNLKEDIDNLQKEVYEPTRQTSIERFKVCAESPKGICLGFKDNNKLAAIAFSSNLKDHPLERGIRQDPDFLDENCLYMIDTTIRSDYQSYGLGRFLKYALTYLAIVKGIKSIKGRNRDKLAASMLNINLSLGSFEQLFLKEDYPDFEDYRDVIYYQSPLEWKNKELSLGGRIDSLINAQDLDSNYLEKQLPYITNKVCLSNFVSENFLSHVKFILELAPVELQHGYTASGQSECVDKVFKSIVYNSKSFNKDSKVLTFKGHHFGSGSFLSRTLSSENEETFFPRIQLDCPNDNNKDAIIKEIKSYLDKGDVNSIWIEPIQQKTLNNTPVSFLKELRKITNEANTPLIYNETSSQHYAYNEETFFASNSKDIMPDAGFAFLGGQAGIVFLKEEHFVSKPLMMISTWDGDEHSFASYHRGVSEIQKSKKDYLETIKKFDTKIKEHLSQYQSIEFDVVNGRGWVKGSIPQSLKNQLRKVESHYVIDPSYSSMKIFLGQ